VTSKVRNPTSARNIRKSLKIIKFKKSDPLTDSEISELRPQILKYKELMAEAQTQAADLFEAYRNHGFGDLVQYIDAHPPSAYAVAMVIRLAEASDDPDKPSRLGKQKAEKVWGEPKKMALHAWGENNTSGKYKSKSQFAEKFSVVLKQSGWIVAVNTIYKWLPTKKKK
jgi:hypothetical protein